MPAVLWFLATGFAFWCVGCTTNSDPEDLVRRYVELHQAGDVEGLLALHTEDAEFVIPGQNPIRGTAALRDLFSWDAELASELVMEGISIDGDALVIDKVIERNQWFEGLGVSEAHYRPGTRLVLRDGRILGTYPARFHEETRSQVFAEFEHLLQWLSVNRADARERLLPGGKFRYDAPSARLWLEVMQDWNRSKQP